MFWTCRACLAFALPPSAPSPLLVFSLSGAAGQIQPSQQRAPPKGPRVLFSSTLRSSRGCACRNEELSAQEASEVEEVREEDGNIWCSRVREKKCPPPLSARTFLRLCFAALSVKGNMRERPGKLDKAAQKRNGCFLYEAFSLSSRS